MEKLDNCFEKFKHKISVIKESDLQKIKEHLNNVKNENLRLENEIKRLNFIVETFIKEKEILEIGDVWEILNKRFLEKKCLLKNNWKKNLVSIKKILKSLLKSGIKDIQRLKSRKA